MAAFIRLLLRIFVGFTTSHLYSSSVSGQLESEFQILKSLIPDIANRQQINELEIIDACVDYIETLQTQLNVVSKDDQVQDLLNNNNDGIDSIDNEDTENIEHHEDVSKNTEHSSIEKSDKKL
jgi:hypothetical protein